MLSVNRRMLLSHIEKQIPGEHPQAAVVRQHLADVCMRFVDRRLADPKFLSELASGSTPKFWACLSEALLADQLRDKAFGARAKVGEGPDFLVMAGTRRVWIEVVCPEPSRVPSSWLKPKEGDVIHFPHEEILLRWTSAIKAKAEVLIGSIDEHRKGYLSSGVVGPDDAYVIAVNGCQLRSGPFPALIGISQFPFAAEAVFPIGPYQLQIDRETLSVIEGSHQHRPYVLNKNGARVPAYTFLDPRFNAISAIWAVDMNGGAAVGSSEPAFVVHNPNASNPIPLSFLPADAEYVAVAKGDGYELSKVCVRVGSDG